MNYSSIHQKSINSWFISVDELWIINHNESHFYSCPSLVQWFLSCMFLHFEMVLLKTNIFIDYYGNSGNCSPKTKFYKPCIHSQIIYEFFFHWQTSRTRYRKNTVSVKMKRELSTIFWEWNENFIFLKQYST